jgi:prepilin-type N-terminal cleavage/methylation domain-containing protein
MKRWQQLTEDGFTIVELILAIAIFPILVIGLSNAFDSVRKSYTTARQLNEMYTVLSACPEIDRALEFNSLSSTTNCFPNNSFTSEGAGASTITYTPNLTVTDTSTLPSSDPVRSTPDSKIINISVGFPNSPAPPMELRMLVTRNGIGQL